MMTQRSRLPVNDTEAEQQYDSVGKQLLWLVSLTAFFGWCYLMGWALTSFSGTMQVGVFLITLLAPILITYLVYDYWSRHYKDRGA